MVTGSLRVAREVLSLPTLQAVLRRPFGLVGWKILDRWAFNSPQKLLDLERQGLIVFLTRLLEQQQLEVRAITNARVADCRHLTEHEILELAGIKEEL